MCELHPPVFIVPEGFVVRVEFIELSVGIKYVQEDVLWEFIIVVCQLRRRPLKVTSERPLSKYRRDHTYL